MREGRWELGICGTFDVANYGDLLFPPIAELELTERLGPLTLHRFSFHAKTPPDWPYQVHSVSDLPRMMGQLDGLLVGGGFLIRFDRPIAPGYFSPSAEIHDPTGYWLTPALMALQHNVPVVWNAPGTDGKEVPGWAEGLMELALTHSRYIGVRDEESRATMQSLTKAPVTRVPDTAFGLPRLLKLDGPPSEEFVRICGAAGLNEPYLVLQAKPGLEGFTGFLKKHRERLRNFKFLVLPIGPILGDRQAVIDAELPGAVRLVDWPSPLGIAELIGRSEGVVGQSYHLCISAMACGVPVFGRHNLYAGKYSGLQESERFFELPADGAPELEWFLARVGRKGQCSVARATCQPLTEHWDRIAAAFRSEGPRTAPAMNRYWQRLPILLEDSVVRDESAENRRQLDGALERLKTVERDAEVGGSRLRQAAAELATAKQEAAARQGRLDEMARQLTVAQAEAELATAKQEAAARQSRLDEMARQLTMARAETAARDARIAEILDSRSWKLTAPLRAASRDLGKHGRRPSINVAYIRHHRMEQDPFAWAAINNLFQHDDLTALTGTYPCDHFKRVARSDAERVYEYEARELIGMGAERVSYAEELSEAWRRLAADLLSAEYRAAMSRLTGRDLSRSPVEANVFHYGPGGSQGPHQDLPEKLVTHVLYFNRAWNGAHGGCLRILRSANVEDIAAEVPPIAGYSSVIVRSEKSWHAVSQVSREATWSRRAVVVTFYSAGSVSTMWPPDEKAALHRYEGAPDLNQRPG